MESTTSKEIKNIQILNKFVLGKTVESIFELILELQGAVASSTATKLEEDEVRI